MKAKDAMLLLRKFALIQKNSGDEMMKDAKSLDGYEKSITYQQMYSYYEGYERASKQLLDDIEDMIGRIEKEELK